MLATMFTTASTSIGAGILGLSAATADSGYLMTLMYLVAIGADTVFSCVLLIQAAELSGEHTYERMASKLFFKRADIMVAIIRIIKCAGSCVAYVICIVNLLTPMLVDDNDNNPTFWHNKRTGIRLLAFILWALCMLPLVIPRQINSLRYVSTVGVAFMIYFVVVVVVRSIMGGLDGHGVVPVATGNEAVGGVGIFMFSFFCSSNVNDVYREMTNRSVKRYALCCGSSMVICAVLYYAIGLFGYLHFGADLDGSILLKYDPLHQPDVLVSFIGVFIKVCASYGLIANACRNSLYHLLGWDPITVIFWKHCVAVVSLSICFVLAGLFIPNINVVFSFEGGVCGGTLGFIFPALFRMYVGDWNVKTVGWANYIATYLTLYGGCVGIVFGTLSTIYSVL